MSNTTLSVRAGKFSLELSRIQILLLKTDLINFNLIDTLKDRKLYITGFILNRRISSLRNFENKLLEQSS